MPSDTPTTEAGRTLDAEWPGSHIDRLEWQRRIVSIENAARRVPTAAAIHEATDNAGLPCDGNHSKGWGTCQQIAERLPDALLQAETLDASDSGEGGATVRLSPVTLGAALRARGYHTDGMNLPAIVAEYERIAASREPRP
jgi:hypothetical protein